MSEIKVSVPSVGCQGNCSMPLSQPVVLCHQSWAFLGLQKHHPVSAFFIMWCVPCISVSSHCLVLCMFKFLLFIRTPVMLD